ncbi:MAG: hypothetical protein FWC53_03715 [Firmicutes bacterium]|nr:hypothetical protein [Bacillota bacterium]
MNIRDIKTELQPLFEKQKAGTIATDELKILHLYQRQKIPMEIRELYLVKQTLILYGNKDKKIEVKNGINAKNLISQRYWQDIVAILEGHNLKEVEQEIAEWERLISSPFDSENVLDQLRKGIIPDNWRDRIDKEPTITEGAQRYVDRKTGEHYQYSPPAHYQTVSMPAIEILDRDGHIYKTTQRTIGPGRMKLIYVIDNMEVTGSEFEQHVVDGTVPDRFREGEPR